MRGTAADVRSDGGDAEIDAANDMWSWFLELGRRDSGVLDVVNIDVRNK